MGAIHDFWIHYQAEILIQFAVVATCWIVALVWDLFAPSGLTDQQVRRQVFLICIPVGFAVSMVLWNNMNDPDHDRTAIRIVISLLGSCLSGLGAPYFNRWIGAFIRWKWPGLNTYSSFTKTP
jgi:hypothetical protein